MNLWFNKSTPRTLKELKSSGKGLSSQEVSKRLKRYGSNELQEMGRVRWYHILLNQFLNIMVLILVVAAGVSFLAEEHVDGIAITLIIVINVIIGFIQEFKAERAVEALKKMAAPFAHVLRDGEMKKIAARDLVPGDVVLIEEGMQVPADIRLMELAQLKSIEASLTGESLPVAKALVTLKKAASLGDMKNMLFLGTVVSQGHGKGVVVDTGMRTEFGKIAHLVQNDKDDPTPLQVQLNHLSKGLALMVVLVAAGLFLLSWLTGRDLMEMFLLSISLAVSVIPEGLPAVITLTLAVGVQQIAKRNAIVRKLSAAETLGSTSVICTDKTGTLTQNQMTVQKLFVNGEHLTIKGTGYDPTESFPVKSEELRWLLKTSALCNNANLLKNAEGWTITGDPTEGALLTLAAKGGLDAMNVGSEWKRKKELVFDSDRKRMSTWNDKHMFTKGAPDSLLEVCTHILLNGKRSKLTNEEKKRILKENALFAKDAFRVLGFAIKNVTEEKQFVEEGLTFLGLAAMMDPPRPEVKAAITTCQNAHIRVIMITGDHALTAQAIGEQIGLYQNGDPVLTGAELESMSDPEISKAVETVSIFSRVNPNHKVKILRALQGKGHIVAMTGDGVNDAPALKRADIGIAMGITGTDVSKQASDMILTDDNFATIVETVERGRIIYRNIKKFIRFLLSANFDEVLVISIIFLLGYPLPFLPLQILWVNLLTDALPALALGVDNGEKNIMNLKPRNPKRSILRDLAAFSVLAGLVATGISLFIFFETYPYESIEKVRTLMFTTIVVFELFLVFSVRHEDHSLFHNFFSNKLLFVSVVFSLGLQCLAIYHPFFQSILQTEALALEDWVLMIGASIFGILILEIWKQFHPSPIHV